jgi:hypothetical protein
MDTVAAIDTAPCNVERSERNVSIDNIARIARGLRIVRRSGRQVEVLRSTTIE